MIGINKYFGNYYKGSKSLSLNAMKYFMNIYDNFENKMNFIHIAGTNGKGSCTEILSNILECEGYRVGKFLSPHLIKYNERISINKKQISNKEMVNLINELEPYIINYNKKEQNNITLFELETIMALLYFYRNNVDFVVLETGLGGLYDCTNIISRPLVSIITSIGEDHINRLGNSLEKIAQQKAGIIKKDSNTVIFSQEKNIDQLFINECKIKNNKLHVINGSHIKNYKYNEKYQYFDYKEILGLKLNLKGKCQIKNACVCIETINILKKLGYMVHEKNLKMGLKTVINKGRMEILNKNPKIIFDGAHNEPAILNFQQTIKMYYNNYKKIYIIAILKRKEYKKMLKILSQDKNAIFIFVSLKSAHEFASNNELYKYMTNYVDKNKLFKMSLNNSLEYVINMKKNQKNITCIIGSLYSYGIVIKKIQKINKNKIEKR